jgi:large repetitive protein
MSKQYNVKVMLPDGAEQMNVFAAGKTLRLKAAPQAKYMLIDAQSGVAPDVIKAKRVGKDLHIDIADDDQGSVDVVIEGYYDSNEAASLVGQAENGSLYDYAPQLADAGLNLASLSGEQAIAYVLGEVAVASGAAVGVLAFNPLLAGVGVAGAAAAAGGGGGGGGAPEVVRPASPTVSGMVNTFNDDGDRTGTQVRGTAQPGTVVQVRDGATVLGSALVDANGGYTVTVAPALASKDYTVVATNSGGGVSDPATISGDATPPNAPTISLLTNVRDAAGDVTQTRIEGQTEPNAVVAVVAPNGDVLGTAVADSSGKFTIEATPGLVNGDEYNAVAVDQAGNMSQPTRIVGDTTAPNTPVVTEMLNQFANGQPTGTLLKGVVPGSQAEPGTTVRVYNTNNVVIASATVQGNGTFEVLVQPAIPDGAVFNVFARDPYSNVSFPAQVRGDLQPPAAPTSYQVLDDVVAITGELKNGDATNDATPTFRGTGATPGNVIRVYDGDTVVGSAAVQPDGTWSVTTSPLAEGPHALSVAEVDRANNESPRSPVTNVTVDTVAPGLPTNVVLTDNVGATQGPITNNSETDDATPSISGTAAAGTAVVNVYNNGQLVGSAAVNPADQSWSFTPAQALVPGNYSWTAAGVDVAGNVGQQTPAVAFRLVNDAPDAAAITAVVDNVGPLRGVVAKDSTTDDRELEVQGTGEAGKLVRVYADGVEVGSATINDGGQWSVVTTALADGGRNITARIFDGANPVGAETGAYRVQVDTTAPNTPTFTVTDNVGPTQGTISPSPTASTDDATPTFSGTGATPGDTITLRDGPTVIGTAVVKPDGSWSLTPTVPLTDGPHTLSVTASDPAGNQSAPATFPVGINTSAQPVSIVRALDNQDAGVGEVAQDGVTNDKSPTLEGTGRPGAVVTISEGAQTLGSTTVAQNGSWSFTVANNPADGVRTYTATQPDATGTGSTNSSFTLTIDSTAPAAPTGFVISDDVGAEQGPLANNDSTDDTTPTFSGTGATPGDVIRVYDGATVVGSAAVKPDGTWSVTTTPLAEGPHALSVTQTDAAGNESDASPVTNLTVDTTAPGLPTNLVLTDNVGAQTGAIANNGSTDDSTPTLSGSAPTGSTSVKIYSGNTVIGSAAVAADGTWSFTPAAALQPQTYAWSAAAVDAAGNESARTPALNFTLLADSADTAAITAVLDNVGAVQGLVAKDGSTDDRTLEVRGTGEAGKLVRVYSEGVEVGSATINSNGQWSVTTSQLGLGENDLTARVFDGANPVGAETGAYRVQVDTTAPNTPTFTVTDNVGPTQGTISPSPTASTDDATPTVSGTGATSGDTITVRDGTAANAPIIGTAVVKPDGSWSVTPTQPLSDGPHTLSVSASDPAGNQSTPATFPLTVATGDQPVSIVRALDNQDAVVGEVAQDGVTNDKSPTLEGTGRAGAVVTISEGAQTLGSTTVRGDGSWSFTVANNPADGVRTYTATQPNATGTGSTNSSFALTIDSTAPNAPSGFEIRDDVGAQQGLLANNDRTDDTTPTVSGVGATPGDVIRVYDGNTVVGSAAVQPNGTWSVTTTPLAEGAHPLSVTQTDAAGNESPRSPVTNLNIDTTAPAAPTAVQISDNAGEVTGLIANNGATDDTTPTISGKAADGAQFVNVYNGNTLIGTANVDANGDWTFTPTVALAAGSYGWSAAAVDAAGNESPRSPVTTFAVVTDAPAAPAISDVVDNVGVITGTVAKDATTNDTTLEVKGTGVSGNVVRLFNGNTELGSATVDAQGNWSVTTPVLADGAVNFTALQVNPVGQRSPLTGEYRVVVDTAAPNQPNLVGTDDVGSRTGTIDPNSTTDDASPTFSGTGISGDVIIVRDGTTVLGSTNVGANGTWSFTPATPLADGAHSISVIAQDPAGNQSAPSTALAFTVDTSNQPVSISRAVDNTDPVQGNVANNGVTNDTTPTLEGTGRAGAVVTIKLGTTELGSTTVAQDGSWTFTLPTQTEGPKVYTADALDRTGNPSTANFTLTIDTTAPNAPTGFEIRDDVGAQQGLLANNDRTDDTTPTVSGVGATPGDVIRVYDGNTVVGSAAVKPDGTWSVTTTPLAEGAHPLSVTQTDAAGNESPRSPVTNITVDTTAPGLPTNLVLTDNVGAQTGAIANNGTTDDSTPTLSGSAPTGSTSVKIYSGNTVIGSAAVAADGTWSFTPAAALQPQTYAWSAAAVDAAGNESARTPNPALNFTLIADSADTAAITAVLDNVGAVQGLVAKDGSTDDRTLEVRGTGEAGKLVRVYSEGVEVGSATINSNGQWSVTTSQLGLGENDLTARVFDGANPVGAETGAYRVQVDTTAPNTPTFTVTDNVGPTQGTISPSPTASTDDATPTVSGTGATSGDTITVRDGTAANAPIIGTAVVKPDGSWSVTPTQPLSDGPHTLSVSASDPAGNQSTPATFPLTVATGDQPVSIVRALDNQDAVVGEVAQDGVTNDKSPTLEGTGRAGAVVTISEGAQTLGSTTVRGDGSWSFTVANNPADGVRTYTATQPNATGTGSTNSSFALTIDSTAPNAPSGFEIRDDVGAQQGLLANNDRTDDTTPTVSGVGATPGDVIRVYDGNTVVGSAAVQPNGTWSVTTTPLAEGAHPLSVTQTDAAGNESPRSPVTNLNIDTTAPTTTVAVTAITDDVGVTRGTVSSGGVTDDTQVGVGGTLSASLTAGDTVRVYDGTTFLGTATVNGTNWTFADPRTLTNGQTVSYTARVADAALNEGPVSNTYTATVDTTAPTTTAAVTAINDDVGVVTGTVANGGVTDDTQLGVSGTLTAALGTGESVRVYDGSTFLGTATVSGTTWTFADTRTLTNGQTVRYTAQVADTAGNQSAAGTQYTATVDLTAPTTTAAVTAIADDVGSITGTVASGGVTDDTQLGVSGTITAALVAGESVRVYDGTTFLGTATVTGTNWTFADTRTLTNAQTVRYTAQVADTAGNQSAAGTAYSATVDTSAPNAQTTTVTVADVTADNVLNAAESAGPVAITGTVTGEFRTGDVVSVTVNNVTTTGTVAANGSFSVNVAGSDLLADTDRTVEVRVAASDAVGNVGNVGDTQTYTIDTTAPTITAAVTAITDDIGRVTGTVASGGTTDDTQLGVSGTITAALAAGDTVRVYDGSTFLGTATVNGTNWTFADTRTLTNGQTVSYTARVADAALNEGNAGTPYTATVDLTAPNAQTTTITVDNVTADNILNPGEITGNVTVTGTVGGEFTTGDVVTLTINNSLFSATVNAQGVFSIPVPGADLRDDSNLTIDATVAATDAAGNRGNVSNTKSYELNRPPVDGDETLGATEGTAFTAVNLLDNASDPDAGANLAVTVNSTTGTFANLVTVTNGQLSIDTANASLNTLAAGQTSDVIVNYTVSDGRGGSDTSSATITFTGVNDAPTVQTTTITNNASLYGVRRAQLLSITDIDGTSSESRVPTGWTRVGQTTPDINDAQNNAWRITDPTTPGFVPGQDNFAYLQRNLNGVSTDGGQFVGLVSRGATSEAMTTTLTNLVVGTDYAIAVQWQQASLEPSLINEGYYGGQLIMFTEGNDRTGFSSSGGLTDGWQTAIYRFRATGTSQVVTVQIDGLIGIAPGAQRQGGYIVVDSLTAAQFDDTANANLYTQSAGVRMSALFPATNVADADSNSAFRGYAITSAANGAGTSGGWQYSPDGGGTWFSLSAASVSNAFFLAPADLVRYTGLRGSNTRLDMVMVDNTGPALHGTNLQATTIDVSVRGGTTPFSQQVVSLAANAAPVLIDLDGDGRISYSTITGDINLDGLDDQSNWVAGNDGILFHDKMGDGQLHQMDQFAFAQYGGNTDLEGLAIAFDGNKDGVFNAQDATFDAFKVWQDLNQDGRVDGGELHSLLSLGITSIALKSDGVERSPVAGVTEHGHSQATLANGGSLLVVDASLDYQHGVDLQAQAAEAERLKASLVI